MKKLNNIFNNTFKNSTLYLTKYENNFISIFNNMFKNSKDILKKDYFFNKDNAQSGSSTIPATSFVRVMKIISLNELTGVH